MFNGFMCFISVGVFSTHLFANELQPLTDLELSNIQGQALLSLSQNDGVTAANSPLSFFKLSAEANIDINANVKRLQLGCGGVNGAGGCDVDISNLSISGAPDSFDALGNPVYNNGRASTSAEITNPFLEFAIKNPNSIATREVVGFRLGAEQILGMLTVGSSENNAAANDGLLSFSGYLQLAQTSGNVFTQATKFGDDKAGQPVNAEQIQGFLRALGANRTFTSQPADNRTTGITIPSVAVPFTVPQSVVTGRRMASVTLDGIRATAARIPLAAGSGIAGVDDAAFAQDGLYVTFPAIAGFVDDAIFKPADGSSLTNLNIDVTLNQRLNLIRNIPLSGSGGYLSLQSENLRWNGANADDIAQRGWWLSFKDPIQLGVLNPTERVNINSTLPNVASLVTQFLTQEQNRIQIPFGEALGAAFNDPVVAPLQINLGPSTRFDGGTPTPITLNNLVLQNQVVTPNCYGNLKFC